MGMEMRMEAEYSQSTRQNRMKMSSIYDLPYNHSAIVLKAPWLRASAALAKDPGWVSSTHVAAHNYLQLQFQKI